MGEGRGARLCRSGRPTIGRVTPRNIIMGMRSALARFLLRRRGDAKADHQVPLLALQDGGWFRENTGELVAGFAIEAEDIVVDVGCSRSRSSPPLLLAGAPSRAGLRAGCVRRSRETGGADRRYPARWEFFHALHWILFWGDGPGQPNPTLAHWATTLKSLLDAPNGPRIRRALDTLMPKNQAIIARKVA